MADPLFVNTTARSGHGTRNRPQDLYPGVSFTLRVKVFFICPNACDRAPDHPEESSNADQGTGRTATTSYRLIQGQRSGAGDAQTSRRHLNRPTFRRPAPTGQAGLRKRRRRPSPDTGPAFLQRVIAMPRIWLAFTIVLLLGLPVVLQLAKTD
ncbi:protein of unknown function [Trichlorobacter ammonificans]|uniref:Uncharacterized protein n=1 Tax=Trichlorobacter ammonificans TaxID=2916410 RepID=A0ABN8HKR9_9BACT|nr:protein of unknown function [Trichlorobacter ammonificans]